MSPARKRATKKPTARARTARKGSRSLLAATERELQRIVLDMHDGPVQDIFAAVSHLQLVERDLDEASQRRVRQAIMLLERTLLEIRNFIGAFRPPGFERRGLDEIIEGLTVQHETLTNQQVDLVISPDVGDCALEPKIAFYRILQEALANGFRHSGATRQKVTIDRAAGNVRLVVTDDGRGFSTRQVLAREADVAVEGGHFGLRGIQDRVDMLGGQFSVESSPGHGTTLTVTLPAE